MELVKSKRDYIENLIKCQNQAYQLTMRRHNKRRRTTHIALLLTVYSSNEPNAFRYDTHTHTYRYSYTVSFGSILVIRFCYDTQSAIIFKLFHIMRFVTHSAFLFTNCFLYYLVVPYSGRLVELDPMYSANILIGLEFLLCGSPLPSTSSTKKKTDQQTGEIFS